MPHEIRDLLISLWLLTVMPAGAGLAGEAGKAFRGLTPPPAGQIGGRLTVSITPLPQPLPPDQPVAPPSQAPPSAEMPAGAPPEGDQGRLLRRIAAHYGEIIRRKVQGSRVPPGLVIGLIAVESGGRQMATSGRGASGLMQLMPATAAAFGVEDPADPASKIGGGIAYLDHLLDQFGGDIVLALAGYNAGPGAVRRHKGVPPFAETRRFVPEVLAAWQLARRLCLAPAEPPQEGCPGAAPGLH